MCGIYFKDGLFQERWNKHRGVEQRNLGLQWLRKNKAHEDTGAVYFMDDDNTYNIKIFTEVGSLIHALLTFASFRILETFSYIFFF